MQHEILQAITTTLANERDPFLLSNRLMKVCPPAYTTGISQFKFLLQDNYCIDLSTGSVGNQKISIMSKRCTFQWTLTLRFSEFLITPLFIYLIVVQLSRNPPLLNPKVYPKILFSSHPQKFSLRLNLILYVHLCLVPPSGFFPLHSPTTILYVFLISPISATCPTPHPSWFVDHNISWRS